jgi:hypothetical protein
MCERQIQIRDAYDKICTKKRTSVLTGHHRSDRWSSQHTQLGGTGQTGAPDWSDRLGPVRAQSNRSACYLVQGDQARAASRLRSLCSI